MTTHISVHSAPSSTTCFDHILFTTDALVLFHIFNQSAELYAEQLSELHIISREQGRTTTTVNGFDLFEKHSFQDKEWLYRWNLIACGSGTTVLLGLCCTFQSITGLAALYDKENI